MLKRGAGCARRLSGDYARRSGKRHTASEKHSIGGWKRLKLQLTRSGKPLWLQVMEKGGGMIILLGVILTAVLGSNMNKRLSSAGGTSVKITGYLGTLSVFMFLIVSVVLVVSLKL